MIVPMIGPSMVPIPPMTTMKITKAVQSFTAEGSVRRDAQLLKKDQRADHRRHRGDQHI